MDTSESRNGALTVIEPYEWLLAVGGWKVFGPTFDEIGRYMGDVLHDRLRLDNVKRVVANANSKIQPGAPEGTIPIRLAMRLLDEGSHSDDPVVVEYLGGVLASSRTPGGRDDRGNTFTALIARMSTYELRTHYIWYKGMRDLHLGREINLGMTAAMARIFVPTKVWQRAMDFESSEDPMNIETHVIYSLLREQLIDRDFATGEFEFLRLRGAPDVGDSGTIVSPSVFGASLFLWAHGLGQHDPDHLFSADLSLPEIGIEIPPGILSMWSVH